MYLRFWIGPLVKPKHCYTCVHWQGGEESVRKVPGNRTEWEFDTTAHHPCYGQYSGTLTGPSTCCGHFEFDPLRFRM